MYNSIGYARVSTNSQELQSQIDALLKYGCLPSNIYTDVISGAKAIRPGLDACINALNDNSELVVLSLDRLGRSLPDLINLISLLEKKKIPIVSIMEGKIDRTTAMGDMMVNMIIMFAQFIRKWNVEKTKRGLEAARSRGKLGGRPKIRNDNPKVVIAKKLHMNRDIPIKDICQQLNINRATFYNYLKK